MRRGSVRCPLDQRPDETGFRAACQTRSDFQPPIVVGRPIESKRSVPLSCPAPIEAVHPAFQELKWSVHISIPGESSSKQRPRSILLSTLRRKPPLRALSFCSFQFPCQPFPCHFPSARASRRGPRAEEVCPHIHPQSDSGQAPGASPGGASCAPTPGKSRGIAGAWELMGITGALHS